MKNFRLKASYLMKSHLNIDVNIGMILDILKMDFNEIYREIELAELRDDDIKRIFTLIGGIY